jgi:integrase
MASRIGKAGLKAFQRTIAPGRVGYLWDNGLGAKVMVAADGTATVAYVFKGRVKGGKARWRALGDDRDAAEKQAAIWRGDLAAGRDPFAAMDAVVTARRDGATVAAKSTAWMEWNRTKERPIAARTAANYRTMLDRHILPAIGDRPVAAVSVHDMGRLRSRFVDTPTLGNRVRAVLSSLFEWARVRPNPAGHFDKFPERARERELSDVELIAVGDALRAMEIAKAAPVHAIALVRALMLTGCRPSELATLKWSAVHFDTGRIDLGVTKARKKDPRVKHGGLPITPALAVLLRELPRVEGNDHVFPGNRTGSRVWAFGAVWKQAVARAGIDTSDPDVLVPYVLRHTAGAVAGESYPQTTIAGILGHKRIETAGRYARPRKDATTLAADAVAGRIAALIDRKEAR